MSVDSSDLERPQKPSSFLAIIEVVLTGLGILLLPAYAASYLLIAISNLGTSVNAFFVSDANQTFIQFLYIALTEAIIIALIVYLLRKFRMDWKAIAVSRPKPVSIGWALVGFLVYLASYIAVYTLANSLLALDTGQKQELGFDDAVTGVNLVYVFLSLVVLPPIIEEIVFRGYLYTRLRRALAVVPAAIIISIVFAFGHLQLGSGNALLWVAALDTFVLSMVLVWLREKTGNIWAGVGVHALKNALAFVSLFILQM